MCPTLFSSCTLEPLHSCILLLSCPCTMLLSKPFALTCTCSTICTLCISSSWLTFDCTFVPAHACLHLPTPFMLHCSSSCLFVPVLAFLHSLCLHSPVYFFMFPCTCSHPLCQLVPAHNLHACLCLHVPLAPLCWSHPSEHLVKLSLSNEGNVTGETLKFFMIY